MRVFVLIALFWASTASAQQGRFDAALDAWLSGEDLPALQIIAEQATAGDGDARLFLGVVEHMGELHGPQIAALSRAERIALFRAPQGVSGLTWLAELDTPLVALIRDLGSVNTTPETVAALMQRGETRLAREAIRAQAKREYFDLVTASLMLVPELTSAVAGRAPDAPPMPVGAALAPATNPDAALPRALCGPDCTAQCLDDIMASIGGHDGLMQLGSPLVALIPEAVWQDSARGVMSVAGLANLRGTPLPDCVE